MKLEEAIQRLDRSTGVPGTGKSIKIKHQNLINTLSEFLLNKSAKLHPHITLATQDFSRQNFKNAWTEFKEKSYSAESLTLFRHNGKTWNVLETFFVKK